MTSPETRAAIRTSASTATTRPGSACDTTTSRRTEVIGAARPRGDAEAGGDSRESEEERDREAPRGLISAAGSAGEHADEAQREPERSSSERDEAQRAVLAQPLRERLEAGRRDAEEIGAQRPAERARASRGAARGRAQRDLLGSGQGRAEPAGRARPERESGVQEDRSVPEGVSSALPAREGPEAGDPVGEPGERRSGSEAPESALQGLGQGPGGHDQRLAGRAGAGVGGGIGGKDGFRAGGNRLGVNRIQGARARCHVTSPANLSFNTTLARKSLFLTVPRGIFLTTAISS